MAVGVAEFLEGVKAEAKLGTTRDARWMTLAVFAALKEHLTPGEAGNRGFDAARKEYVDIIEAGIIDPTKVVGIALENAVSAASLLLLTEATLTEVPEAKEEKGPPME